MRKGSEGFTLMEILIAMAIMAIVGTLGFSGWMLQTQKTRDARRKSDLKQLSTALSGYFDDNGCYPDEEVVVCGGKGLVPYMSSVVCDPSNNGELRYVYQKTSCTEFAVFTKLEYKSDTAIETSGCSEGCGPENKFNYTVNSND